MLMRYHLPPTCLIHKWNEPPYLPLLPSHTALPYFCGYSFPIPLRVGGRVGPLAAVSEITVLPAAITEMLPSILSQLGPESVDNLRWLASTLSKTGDDSKVPSSAAAAPIAEEDEEVPGLHY